MENNKKLVRLTEGDLYTMIQEAVNMILEGQGWNYFKNHMDKLDDATPEERIEIEKQMRDPKYKYGARAQFVGHGDFDYSNNVRRGKQRNHYDGKGEATPSHGGKPINDTFKGRLGRYAGVKGAELVTRGINKFHKWAEDFADPDKNPFSPFSKEGPTPFDEGVAQKQTVSLSESDLHNIIRESVNTILNELNWKTYFSAADKDKDPERARRFRNQAVDTFNKEFGYESPNEDGSINGPESTYMLDNGSLYSRSQNMDNGVRVKHQFVTPKDADPNDENPTSCTSRGYDRSTSQGYVKRPYTSSKPHARAMQRAADEHNAWRKDEYTYNKGIGYHNTNNKTDWHDYLDYNNQ